MEHCLNCGKTGAYAFEVLEIQTLHVRDLKGESRVQALSERREFAICRTCAADTLSAIRRPTHRAAKACGLYGGIFLLGVVLCLAFWSTQGALRLMGLAAIVCGGIGLFSTLQTIEAQKAAYAILSEKDALAQAAWETLLRAAPKKAEDTDLTYLPINAKTLAMKNGDLMVVFDLLPAVAAKAYDLLHGDGGGGTEPPPSA